MPNEVEAGTGYFKESFLSTQIDKSLSSIQVSNPNNSVVWGYYYQYFETLIISGNLMTLH